jgi:hypothetical protein
MASGGRASAAPWRIRQWNAVGTEDAVTILGGGPERRQRILQMTFWGFLAPGLDRRTVVCDRVSIVELAKALPELVGRRGGRPAGWRWLEIKLLMSIWVRNFFTLAVSRDIYEGVQAIYLDCLATTRRSSSTASPT